jgi:GDP-4-dehydro-6-deoxy-D-mannose reductase
VSDARRIALITGAGGFVGTHLIAELQRETDWDIVGVSQRTRTGASIAKMLACDLTHADLVRRVLDRHRPDIIFHLAAQSYVPRSFASPVDTLANNITAQVNLLEGCRSVGIDPIVLIVGSSDEYGLVRAEDLPITEAQEFRPLNPYAVSKIAQDMLGLQYHLAHGMRVIRVRPFNHFGPGQSDRFVVANFARQIVEAELGRIEPVILTGDLSAERDFLDVRDVARAHRLAIDRAVVGEVYNVASGVSWQIGELLRSLIALGSVAVEIRQDPARLRPSDTPRVIGDATKFAAATGWAPRIRFATSLQDTLEDWRRALHSTPSSVERGASR